MPFSIRDLKRRMKSVQNTGQITRAMEAVSATKMRKAQQVALAARPYATKALELLSRVSATGTQFTHWLLEARPVERVAVVLVTSDKGLCGVLNANVLRLFERFVAQHAVGDIIAVGKYGARYARRRKYNVVQEYEGIGDIARLEESQPVSSFLLATYKEKRYDAVWAVYTDFISTLRQEAIVRQVLPFTTRILEEIGQNLKGQRDVASPEAAITAGKFSYEYKLEPSPEEVLEELLPALFRVRVHQVILESNASEHSARMLAMKNASENAQELSHELQLSFNKARQASITREIAEITGGAAALEG